MKKKFETSDFEQYFQITNNIAPIYNEEKVHQIINSPEVKARLRGKNNNLLKFTIMTTILAVIISAVLLWPGDDPKLEVSDSGLEVSDSKFQVLGFGSEVSGFKYQAESKEQVPKAIEQTVEQTIESTPIMKKEGNDASATGIESGNEIIAVVDLDKEKSVTTDNSLIFNNEGQADQNSVVAEPSIEARLIDSDIDTFTPIDGTQFIINADKLLLKKLGFQFKGENVFYQNKSSEGIVSVLNFMKVKHDYGTAIINRTLNDKILEDSIITSSFDFYPVISTYLSGDIISSIIKDEFNFENANDTLFPLCIPSGQISNDPNDIILWFKISEEFFNLIPENNHPLKKDYDLIKRKKDQFECNLINYKPQAILNQSNFIELSDKDLLKIGFYVSQFNDPRPHKKGEVFRVLEIDTRTESERIWADCAKNVTWKNILWEQIEIGRNKYSLRKKESTNEIPDLWLYLVSNTEGILFDKINEDTNYGFNNLIPIKVSKHSFDNIIQEDIVFWFKPTDYLFENLPIEISSGLRMEYNYITAEDKSALVKPECTYFEECKNTLEINNFKAYPNPANHRVSVSFDLPKAINARISLVDLAGRERQVLHPQSQFAAGPHQLYFDLSTVAEGIYLLTLYSDKGVQTHRLMVLR